MPQTQLAAQILFDQYKQNQIGVVAAGPAGTGKTETFKYIGARLGYDFLVVNCSDQFGIQQIATCLEEAFTQGNSVIFDEFNRCTIEAVEGISGLLKELQAIKQKFTLPLQANERNTTQTGQFNGHEIAIKASSMAIFTVNPGYAGRTEVPKEFYDFCARMEFIVPQLELLIPAAIAQQGICNNIQQIENLSPKLIGIINNLKERASKQKWYDFGLRAYKKIIKIAQTIKTHEKIESIEEIFLLAVAMKYQALLVQQDIPIFVEVLNSQFSNAQEFILNYRKLKLEQPAVQEKIKNAFADAQLPLPSDIVGDQLLLKASYIAKVQNIGTGVLLYGDYQKSDQLLNLSSKLVKQHSGSDIVLHGPIDFDSQNNEQLYEQPGSIVNATQEAVEDQSGKLHWILLKGAISAEKVENLNTVLDANQVLFLNNGQRINIPTNVKFIFQTNDLDMSSPAFISRVVFVNTE